MKLSVSPFVSKMERKGDKAAPYNNLFIKQFPREDLSVEDLTVINIFK